MFVILIRCLRSIKYKIWRKGGDAFAASSVLFIYLLAKHHDFRQIVYPKCPSPLLMQYIIMFEKRGSPSIPVNPSYLKPFDSKPFIHLFRQIVSDSISHLLFIAACVANRLDKLPHLLTLYRIKPKFHMIIPNWNIFKLYLCYNIMSFYVATAFFLVD